MADPGDDLEELRLMLQHYKDEYGAELQKLRDENVRLRAKTAYMQQKLDQQAELLRQASMPAKAKTDPTPSADRSLRPHLPGPSNLTLASMGAASKLTTPPPSSPGSEHDPVVIHSSDEDIRARTSNPLDVHPPAAGPSKRRKTSPEPENLPDFFPPSSKDAGKQPVLKKRKYSVFVLVPSSSPRLDRKPTPSPRRQLEDPWDGSSESSLTSLSSDDDDPPPRPVPVNISRKRTIFNRPSRLVRSPERDRSCFNSPSAIPIEMDDRRDESYVPSRPTSPAGIVPAKRPLRRHDSSPRESSSRIANAKPKPMASSGSVRSTTVSGMSSPTRANAQPGPSSPRASPSSPQRRVTLHVSPPSTVAVPSAHDHLSGLTRFAVHVADPALLRPTVSRTRLSEFYGGSIMRMCVYAGGRNFLFPTLKQNPRLPSNIGMPGLLLRANVEREWKGDVQTLFVGLRGAQYKYVGQYRLTLGERMSVDEYKAMSSPFRQKWAKGVAEKSKYKDIRVRIRTRRQYSREATAEEIALAVMDKGNKYEVSPKDVMWAYESGQERMLVWRMQCVGFDEAFLANLVSRL